MRGIAFRRHTEARRKAWAKEAAKAWYRFEPPTPRQIGHLAHAPAMCSCPMCGNPRRHFKQKTLQELKAELGEY